jgi:hypothetical protein
MLDGLTWAALVEQWPWFVAAAAVLLIAVGLLIVLAPKSGQEAEQASAADVAGHWALTGRIDFAGSHSGDLVLQVEETRSTITPGGVEHRELRWRRATLPEAKTVIEAYHAQRNLAMSPSFAVTGPAGIKRKEDGQGEKVKTELSDAANGQDIADVTLVPGDVVPH